MKYFTNIFLQIEERARTYFERFPFIHAFLGGVGVVLFWRGIWDLADRFKIDPIMSLAVGCLLLGAIGLFIHTFVGNAIIIKNVEKDKQMTKKAEHEIILIEQDVKKEEITLSHLSERINSLEKAITTLINHKS
jgi:dolichyl-phosphate-mannose--protein O-mannosyl transferase